MYIGVHVKYLLFFSDCNKTWIKSTDFTENFNNKFHETPTTDSRVVLCGKREREMDWRICRNWKSLLEIIRKRLTSKHLMLYREAIPLFPQITTKLINIFCGQNVVLCCTQSVIIATLFKITFNAVCVKILLWDYRFDALAKVVISVNFSNAGFSRMFCVCSVT